MISKEGIQASFSLKNRIARTLWGICWVALFRFSPRSLHRWRCFLLRCWGARIGQGCRVYGTTIIWAPWNLHCGNRVVIAGDVELYNQGMIYLEDGCIISQNSYLCTGSHDYTRASFPLWIKPIHIEKNVWVAARCFVHPGVTIGEGAVVGAASVVIKDLPPWMVCAGHPCRPMKPRVMEPA